jgi:hypothetical protein
MLSNADCRRISWSFACKPKDWDCAKFGAFMTWRSIHMDEEQKALNKQLIDAVNAHGSDLQNLNCVIAGLASQLASVAGKDGIEAARVFALQVAEGMPKNGPVRPNAKTISDFFTGHK